MANPVTEPLQPFIWGRGGARLTPEQIARQREMAEALLASGVDTSPVGHWLQGAARMVQGGLGGLLEGRAARAAEENATLDRDLISRALSGDQFPAAPVGGPSVEPMDYASSRVAQAHGDMQPYRDAIASIESAGSGDYGAVGPTHDRLGRALGRYQIMEANIGPWSQEALGRAITADEFLADPSLQDAIFDHRFGQYVNQFGDPAMAAQAWFAGPGGVGTNRQDVLGTSVPEYARRFNAALGQGGGSPQVAAALAPEMAGNTPAQAGGINPAIIEALSSPYASDQTRQIAQLLLGQQMQQNDPMRALEMDYKRAQIEKMQREAAGGNRRYGLNPIYGQDDQGNTVLGVLGDDGSFKPVDTGGVNISTGVDRVDLGTQWGLLDKRSGQMVGTLPKENYQEAFDTASGASDAKSAAAARVDLPKVEDNAYSILSMIDSLDSDPYLDRMVGPVSGRLPNVSGDAARVQSKMDQIGGQAFLQAFETLRGGGQISNVEGQKATDALARLNTAQSPADYRQALNELRGIVRQSLERARRSAGMGSGTQAPPGAEGWQDMGGVRIRRKQ